MSTHVFAVIKRSSKYAYQQPRAGSQAVPFEVQFVDDSSYPVRGNDNHYRISDLNFYVRVADRFVRLS